MAGHGSAPGERRGGRQKGTPNKSTTEKRLRAQQAVQTAMDGGVMPLDVLLCRMRNKPLPDGTLPSDEQVAAAAMAAPFCHPRLATTQSVVQSDNVVRVISDRPLSVSEWQQMADDYIRSRTNGSQTSDNDEDGHD